MQKYNFTLAYCHQNEDIAQEIHQYLSKADIYLKMISDKDGDLEGIGTQLLKEEDHVLLLISTNFLKSIGTMNNILKSVEPLAKKKILHPVIINGREKMPDGSYISVQTNFDRVSHVIQYMNHWQDKYLDARKEKREAPANLINAIEKKLLNIRNISAQIGEFLKLIKTQDHISYSMLSQNNFEAFFARFNIKENHSKIAGLSLGSIGTGALVGGMVANARNKSTNPPVVETPEVVENATPRIIETPKERPPVVTETPPQTPPVFEPQEVKNNNTDLIKEVNPIIPNEPFVEIRNDEIPIQETPDLIETPIDEIEVEDISPISVSDRNEVVPLKIENLDHLEDIREGSNDTPEIPTKSDQEVLNKLIHIKNGDEIGPGFGTNVRDENSVENLSVIQRIIKKREEENNKTGIDRGDDITINGKIGDEVIEMPVNRNQPPTPSEPSIRPYEKSSSDVEQTLHEASNLIEAGKIEKGLAILEEVLYQDPNNVDIRLQYATVLADNLNKKDDAVHHLQKILSIDPHHGNTYVKLGEISESKNNLVIARKYYEKAAALKPNQPWIFYKLGIMISTHFVGENKMAADYFKQSLNLDKNNVDGHYRYAVILSEDLQNYEKAQKHFKKVVKLKPDHKRVHLDLAKLHRKNGNFEKAEKHYLKAVNNYPLIKNENNDALFIQPKLTTTPVKTVVEKPVEVVKKVEQVFRVPQNEIKRVLITGATSGIGKATAELFAKNGHKLILTGRRKDRLDILKLHFEQKYQSDIQLLSFDVTNIEEVRNSFTELSSEWRDIDILINNAGLAKGYDSIHEGELSDWDAMIDTNIKGLLYMTRAFSPIMVEKQSGHIINVGSTAGSEVYPKGNVYCATKFAVDALTKAIRLDLHKFNIRVSQVSPGHVEETEFAKVRFGDADRAKIYEDFQPLKAEDVAESIYFIATRPHHVNIQDILMMGTQQANNNYIDRSGRK